jgi:uncharacterized membrane protein YozB (DUF420 family)
MNGLLGTNAGLASDLSLLAYLLVLLPGMLLGLYFARSKRFRPHHQLTMTAVVVLNWVLIALVMAVSYGRFVAPTLAAGGLSDGRSLLATIHLLTGGVAQLMATYLVLLMWTEDTRFERLVLVRICNIKTPMRATLALWLMTVLLGFGIYAVWYGGGHVDGQDAVPATTEPAPMATEDVDDLPSATEDASEPAATEQP